MNDLAVLVADKNTEAALTAARRLSLRPNWKSGCGALRHMWHSALAGEIVHRDCAIGSRMPVTGR